VRHTAGAVDQQAPAFADAKKRSRRTPQAYRGASPCNASR
jgi:hypothetical protein